MAKHILRKRTASCFKVGSESTFQSVAKMSYTDSNEIINISDSESDSNVNSDIDETTIFNLNEDCLRHLFSFVSVRDLVRSQRVSTQWRTIIKIYLEGTRLYLRSSSLPDLHDNFVPPDPTGKFRLLSVKSAHFVTVMQLFGEAILAADCIDEISLQHLGENCPNLEHLRIIPQPKKQFKIHLSCLKKISKLKRMYFKKDDHDQFNIPYRIQFREWCVKEFPGVISLEKLEILALNKSMIERVLLRLDTNLKSLRLENCKNLDNQNLLSSLDRLTELTEFKLNNGHIQNYGIAHQLISRMPRLEYLGLERYLYNRTAEVTGLINGICDLSMLRHLSLYGNDNVTDDWLEAVGRRCKELRAVSVGACSMVSAAGVMALCRGAGNTLAALDVSNNAHIADDHVEACIKYCPRLEMLDVQYCGLVTGALPARAAEAARSRPHACPCARPLRLHLSCWLHTQDMAYPRNIILDFSGDNHKCENYLEKECSCGNYP